MWLLQSTSCRHGRGLASRGEASLRTASPGLKRQRPGTRTATLTVAPSPVEGLAPLTDSLHGVLQPWRHFDQGNLTCKAAFKGAKHSRGLREFIRVSHDGASQRSSELRLR